LLFGNAGTVLGTAAVSSTVLRVCVFNFQHTTIIQYSVPGIVGYEKTKNVTQ